ncbi:multicopper oxidase domain-containing protein [Kibdelosporangium lantanae]|uniref:Multicopper oxidase domain-containing protein n=1 Tax=Kibdelosporangium lantanae TaxID=1497396 RepID=A0ABW3M9B7_9PSEU
MPTTLTVRAEQHALWLCFEPWANEYTIPRGTTVVIHFNNESTVETTHHAVGITFFTLGRHPDIWSEDDQPLEIFSDYMPRTSTGTPEEAIRAPGYSVGSATGSRPVRFSGSNAGSGIGSFARSKPFFWIRAK